MRTVDDVQYVNRTRSFDFDIVTGLWAQSLSPGNEQREFWGSQAATREGSRNLAGIADPGVDALIDKVIFAKDRDELVAATKALDRVLLAHDYVVPQWTSLKQRTARWNRYSHPETMPRYGGAAFPTIWWYDRGQGRQDGSAAMTTFNRRAILKTGAAAAALSVLPRIGFAQEARDRNARPVELRRAEIRRPTSSISIT